MLTHKRIAVVGSRTFKNYKQLSEVLDSILGPHDELVSGGALGADSMAQRYAREHGLTITIHYPNWYPNGQYDKGAGFARNRKIVEGSDLVLAFYRKDHFQEGGTANTAGWARKLNTELREYKEDE